MPSRQQLYQHSDSYQTISTLAPQGLVYLKNLFHEEDADKPSAATLNILLAQVFRDVENGSERSKGRSDVVTLIVSRRSRYQKYQTDTGQAWCLINSNKTHTVLFEGVRFVVFCKDAEWIRIPVSGRIEVRPIIQGAKPSGEIVFRKMTLDLAIFWRRENELSPSSPNLVSERPQKQHVPLPRPAPLFATTTAAAAAATPLSSCADSRGVEQCKTEQYIHRPARGSVSMLGRLTKAVMGAARKDESGPPPDSSHWVALPEPMRADEITMYEDLSATPPRATRHAVSARMS